MNKTTWSVVSSKYWMDIWILCAQSAIDFELMPFMKENNSGKKRVVWKNLNLGLMPHASCTMETVRSLVCTREPLLLHLNLDVFNSFHHAFFDFVVLCCLILCITCYYLGWFLLRRLFQWNTKSKESSFRFI